MITPYLTVWIRLDTARALCDENRITSSAIKRSVSLPRSRMANERETKQTVEICMEALHAKFYYRFWSCGKWTFKLSSQRYSALVDWSIDDTSLDIINNKAFDACAYEYREGKAEDEQRFQWLFALSEWLRLHSVWRDLIRWASYNSA